MTQATATQNTSWFRSRAQDLKTHPYTDYTIILTVVGFLTLIGVAMVTSSSMTWSVLEGSGVWGNAIRQVVMVAMGIFMMWMMMRVRPGQVQRFSGAILLLAIILLCVVLTPLGTGREEVGSQSWLVLGPVTFQPSEFARLAIAIWGASYLGTVQNPQQRSRRIRLFLLVAAGMAGLIAAEGDIGMVVAFAVVALAIVFFVGVSLTRLLVPLAALGIGATIVLLQRGSFRGERLRTYSDAFFGNFNDTRGSAYQSYQGFLSLADGGLFGVGIGQSRAKWFYLPEARNDFIFAIIGEELGFVGASMVILLFSLLGFMGFRTVTRVGNTYLALLAGALTSSIVIQAFINMGYVVGLLPVTGIQLPLISAGGTSAVITLAAMGLLVNCARHEPDTISAMQSRGRPKFDLVVRLPEPSVEGIGSDGRLPSASRAKQRISAAKNRNQPTDRRPQQRRMTQTATKDARTESGYPQRYVDDASQPAAQPTRHRDHRYRGQAGSQELRGDAATRDGSQQRGSTQQRGNQESNTEQQPQLRRRRPPSNRWR